MPDGPPRPRWFECAAALVDPGAPEGEQETVAVGPAHGTLAAAPRGAGGFGYDPVLVPDGETRTCAELSPQEKDAISHRGQAVRGLAPHLVRLLAGG